MILKVLHENIYANKKKESVLTQDPKRPKKQSVICQT